MKLSLICKSGILLSLCMLYYQFSFSQTNKVFDGKFYKIGINTGIGSVDNIIYSDNDYLYNVWFRKIQIYYRINSGKLNWDILIQPEYNVSEHRLDNPYFIGVNHPEMSYYARKKTMREYVLNIGFLVSKPFSKFWSGYALLSVGPGYHDTLTERMAKGFGFSDNIAFGVNYRLHKWVADLRLGYRHLSNADIQDPNEGYDTVNLEIGLSYIIH